MKSLLSLFILMSLSSLTARGFVTTAGTFVPFVNKVQTNVSGATKKFELNPYIGIGTQIQMSSHQYFVPEIGYSYFLESSKNVFRDTIFIHYDFAYVLSNNFLLRYGITNHWYRIQGEGGTQNLSNGNGKTSFPLPDRTITTYYSTIDIGTEYFFNGKRNAVRFDLNMMSATQLDNRAYNYLLTFNWYR